MLTYPKLFLTPAPNSTQRHETDINLFFSLSEWKLMRVYTKISNYSFKEMRSVNSKAPSRFHWASFPSPHVFVIKSKAAELWQPEIVLSKESSLIVPQMWLLNVCMRETCPLFPFIVLVEFYHCLEMLLITSFSLLFFYLGLILGSWRTVWETTCVWTRDLTLTTFPSCTSVMVWHHRSVGSHSILLCSVFSILFHLFKHMKKNRKALITQTDLRRGCQQ